MAYGKSKEININFYLILIVAVVVLIHGCSESAQTSIGSNFQEDVEILSSDEFEGRAPATPGGEKAKNYIENRFREIGLKPGNGDSFRQAVPLLETESTGFSPLEIKSGSFTMSLEYPDDMVVGSY